MSGGHFDYNKYMLSELVEQLEQDIYSIIHSELPVQEVLECDTDEQTEEVLKQLLQGYFHITMAGIYVNNIDLFFAGDNGASSFLEAIKEDLTKLDDKLLAKMEALK